jgi:hypothetical protein
MIKTAPSNLLDAGSSLRRSSGQVRAPSWGDRVRTRIRCHRADADLYTIDESIFGIKAIGRRQTNHLTAPDSGPLYRDWARRFSYYQKSYERR